MYIFPYTFRSPDPNIWYDKTGHIIIGQKQVPFSSFDDIPPHIINLILSIEDKRFRAHPGIDIPSLIRALWHNSNTLGGTFQGASTIEQQLIKLDKQQFQRGWRAKIQENRRAINMQFHYAKQDILLKYINIIPFSHGIVGRNAACHIYRGKACAYIDDKEALLLLVIGQLGANPYNISDWQTIIKRAQMYIYVYPELFSGNTPLSHETQKKLATYQPTVDPKVSEFLRQETLPGHTAFDLNLYERIDIMLEKTKIQRDQYAINNCCIVVVDEQGNIVTMNTCKQRDDKQDGKTNSCLIPRQTGSAIKPFLYLYAFHHEHLDKKDTIIDEPVQFPLGNGNVYEPKNFDLQYHGEVSYAYALGNSLNIPAIILLSRVGVAPFLAFLQEQLLRTAPRTPLNTKTSDEVGLSLALGTYELSPLAFTQLWRLFFPSLTPPGYEPERQQIVDILSDPTNKIVSFGQDNLLSSLGWATKTGTSRNFIDGWICGITMTKGLVACLWLGNINNTAMLGASSEIGSYLRSLLTQEINHRF